MDIQGATCFFLEHHFIWKKMESTDDIRKKNTFSDSQLDVHPKWQIYYCLGAKGLKTMRLAYLSTLITWKIKHSWITWVLKWSDFWSTLELEVWIGQCWCQSAHGHLEDLEVGESYPDDVQICAVCISLRIQVRPKKGINHTIQLWVWDVSTINPTRNRGSSAFLGYTVVWTYLTYNTLFF